MFLKENRKKVLIVWDNLSACKSKAVNEFLKSNKKRLRIEFLPPYTPELNPQEHIGVAGREGAWSILSGESWFIDSKSKIYFRKIEINYE